MEHQILQDAEDALRITLGWDTRSVGDARKASSVQFDDAVAPPAPRPG